MLPGWLWLHDHKDWIRGSVLKKLAYMLHIGMILLGTFLLVGGTYGVVEVILAAYADGTIGKFIHASYTQRVSMLMLVLGGAFSCADNSASSH